MEYNHREVEPKWQKHNTKSLSIKLISPKMSLRPMDTEMKRRMSPPLSLLTIASMTPKPHKIYIEDENVGKINFEDKPDLIGITINVDTAYRAFEIAKTYRDKGSKVIFGGIYASSCPQDVAEHCDSVCIGEAETLWHTIITDCCNDNLQPQYFNPEPIDLASVPQIDWTFIPNRKKYLYYNIIVASKGCPFKCDFCYNSCKYVSGKYRTRPVKAVVEEIKSIGTKQIMFIDDNFIGNVQWVDELLNEITEMKLIWHAAVSTNLVRYPELIERMSRSGCRSLFIGFESISEDAIESVNKQHNKIEDYEQLIQMLHRNNIMVNASLVFGFDCDTAVTFDKTLNWLVKNKVETMTGHILTPYPGTVLYEKLKQEGRITSHDLTKYNTSFVVFQPVGITAEQLQENYRLMYKRFYSFRNIIKRKPDNRDLRASYYTFNFGYRKFGGFVSFIGRLNLMSVIGKVARRLSYGI